MENKEYWLKAIKNDETEKILYGVGDYKNVCMQENSFVYCPIRYDIVTVLHILGECYEESKTRENIKEAIERGLNRLLDSGIDEKECWGVYCILNFIYIFGNKNEELCKLGKNMLENKKEFILKDKRKIKESEGWTYIEYTMKLNKKYGFDNFYDIFNEKD